MPPISENFVENSEHHHFQFLFYRRKKRKDEFKTVNVSVYFKSYFEVYFN